MTPSARFQWSKHLRPQSSCGDGGEFGSATGSASRRAWLEGSDGWRNWAVSPLRRNGDGRQDDTVRLNAVLQRCLGGAENRQSPGCRVARAGKAGRAGGHGDSFGATALLASGWTWCPYGVRWGGRAGLVGSRNGHLPKMKLRQMIQTR
jgi:hypothetical protein